MTPTVASVTTAPSTAPATCEAPIAQTAGTHGMRAVLCRQSRYIRSWHDSSGTVHRACPKHLAQRTALYAPADAPWPGDLPVEEGEPAAMSREAQANLDRGPAPSICGDFAGGYRHCMRDYGHAGEHEHVDLRPPGPPRPGDHVWLHGDRLLILGIMDRGQGPLIVADDDAGFRIERPADRLVWSAADGAWRA